MGGEHRSKIPYKIVTQFAFIPGGEYFYFNLYRRVLPYRVIFYRYFFLQFGLTLKFLPTVGYDILIMTLFFIKKSAFSARKSSVLSNICCFWTKFSVFLGPKICPTIGYGFVQNLPYNRVYGAISWAADPCQFF